MMNLLESFSPATYLLRIVKGIAMCMYVTRKEQKREGKEGKEGERKGKGGEEKKRRKNEREKGKKKGKLSFHPKIPVKK